MKRWRWGRKKRKEEKREGEKSELNKREAKMNGRRKKSGEGERSTRDK